MNDKADPSSDSIRQEDAEREHMAGDEADRSLDQGVQDDADMAAGSYGTKAVIETQADPCMHQDTAARDHLNKMLQMR